MASQVVEDTSLAMQPLEEQEEESHTSVSALLKQVIVEEDSIQIEKYRERLRNFFWAHDPRRVEKVDEILQRQKGQEEDFLQRVHMQYGARDFSGEIAVDDLYEHERYSYLTFSWGSSFPGHLLPTDRRRWSNLHGTPSSQKREDIEPQLPVNWKWSNDWIIDRSYANTDKDGWTYAFDFTTMNRSIKKNGGKKEPSSTCYVRRRRWIRKRERVNLKTLVANTMAEAVQLRLEQRKEHESTAVAKDSEEFEEQKTSAASVNAQVQPLNHDDQAHTSGNADGKSSKVIPLEIFSLPMDPVAFDTAWKSVIHQLEAFYLEAKENKEVQKKSYQIKKQKLKQQIQLLEKTIQSIQNFLQEEEKKQAKQAAVATATSEKQQQQQQQHQQKSPTFSEAQGSSIPHIYAKLRRYQSKLDALKRMFWFSKEKEYSVRWSVDGIFYGLRDFNIQEIDANFSIHLSHQTNGTPSATSSSNGTTIPPSTGSSTLPCHITPTCRIIMKGHTVFNAQHIKVMGDKGTVVPKTLWDKMYVETDFEITLYLIYVQDLVDPTIHTSNGSNSSSSSSSSSSSTNSTFGPGPVPSPGPGHWDFLFSTDSNRLELVNFMRRVKGGVDLPEPMVRKLCSDVLSNWLRDITLLYFPTEMAYLFDCPPGKMDMEGVIQMKAPGAIELVLEKDMQEAASSTTTAKSSSSSARIIDQIAQVLELNGAQLNLLMALNEQNLCPSGFSLKSITSCCQYVRTFYGHTLEKKKKQQLRHIWKQLMELLFIGKCQLTTSNKFSQAEAIAVPWCLPTPIGVARKTSIPPSPLPFTSSDSNTSTNHSPVLMELFDMDKFFETLERLDKKPMSFYMRVDRLECTFRVLSAFEAIYKLYERIFLGFNEAGNFTGGSVTPVRSGPDSNGAGGGITGSMSPNHRENFVYGFRFGRKPILAAASASGNRGGTFLEASAISKPRFSSYIEMDESFNQRYKLLQQLQLIVHTKLLPFIKQNVQSLTTWVNGIFPLPNISSTLTSSTHSNTRMQTIPNSFQINLQELELIGPLQLQQQIMAWCQFGNFNVQTIQKDDQVALEIEMLLPLSQSNDFLHHPSKGKIHARMIVSDLKTDILFDWKQFLSKKMRQLTTSVQNPIALLSPSIISAPMTPQAAGVTTGIPTPTSKTIHVPTLESSGSIKTRTTSSNSFINGVSASEAMQAALAGCDPNGFVQVFQLGWTTPPSSTPMDTTISETNNSSLAPKSEFSFVGGEFTRVKTKIGLCQLEVDMSSVLFFLKENMSSSSSSSSSSSINSKMTKLIENLQNWMEKCFPTQKDLFMETFHRVFSFLTTCSSTTSFSTSTSPSIQIEFQLLQRIFYLLMETNEDDSFDNQEEQLFVSLSGVNTPSSVCMSTTTINSTRSSKRNSTNCNSSNHGNTTSSSNAKAIRPAPAFTFQKDEILIKPMLSQLDELVNMWVEDHFFPPHSNPIYF